MKYKIDATVRLNIEADSLSKAKELFKDWRKNIGPEIMSTIGDLRIGRVRAAFPPSKGVTEGQRTPRARRGRDEAAS